MFELYFPTTSVEGEQAASRLQGADHQSGEACAVFEVAESGGEGGGADGGGAFMSEVPPIVVNCASDDYLKFIRSELGKLSRREKRMRKFLKWVLEQRRKARKGEI